MGPPNALSSAYLPAGPPVIQLNGNGLPGDGLVLGSAPPGESVSGTSSAGSTIIGLNIYNFTGGAGIHIQTNGNLVTGNFLGTDVNGTAAGPGNGDGVVIDNSASNNTIGGTGAGAGNVISGNSGDGIDISGDGNFVQGNKIGTDVMGSSSLGNQVAGVRIRGSFNTIGGTGSGAGNVISGSKDEGIFVTGGDNLLTEQSHRHERRGHRGPGQRPLRHHPPTIGRQYHRRERYLGQWCESNQSWDLRRSGC